MHLNKLSSRREVWAAAAICLLAWLMFVTNIGQESMWVDEWFSWRYSQMGPFELTRSTVEDVHPPAYYLSLWAWTEFTGTQNLGIMRLTAAFPALLAVAVTYRLGRDWFRQPWVGLGAAAFLATSGIFIYYARELRMYTLIVLLSAASWWMLWRWLTRGGRAAFIGYIVIVSLMLYTYYFSGFIILTQAVFVALAYRQRLWGLIKAGLIFGVLYLPWIPIVIDQIYWERQRSGRTELLGKYGATAPTTLPNIIGFLDTYTAGQFGLVLVLGILAVFASRRTGTRRKWVLAPVLWFVFTVAVFFIVNLWFPIYNQRYPLAAITGLALLAGLALVHFGDLRMRAALVGAIVVIGIAGHQAAFPAEKAPHRDLLETVAAGFQPGDRIWYNMDLGALGSRTIEDVGYHLRFDTPELSTDDFIWDAPVDFGDRTQTRRVWDVRPYWIPMPDSAHEALLDGRTLVEDTSIGAYSVRLYSAPPTDVAPVAVYAEAADTPAFDLLPDTTQATVRAGDSFTLLTWWRTHTAALDYSYTLLLCSTDCSTPAQASDGGLQTAAGQPTSAWGNSDAYQSIKLQVPVRGELPMGTYQIWLGVYYWENPVRFPLRAADEDASLDIDAQLNLVHLGAVHVVD